jgi:hypothetical protein
MPNFTFHQVLTNVDQILYFFQQISLKFHQRVQFKMSINDISLQWIPLIILSRRNQIFDLFLCTKMTPTIPLQTRVGTVLFVSRPLPQNSSFSSEILCYNHAGIVTKVDQKGNIIEVVDFDPTFDQIYREISWELLKEALTGIWGRPRYLRGQFEIESVFDPSHTFEQYSGAISEKERDKILQRVREALKRDRLYLLTNDNCQHFATEMRFGTTGK